MFRANLNMQLTSMMYPDVAVPQLDAVSPLQSAQTQLQNARDLQHTVEHIPLTQQYHCTKCLNTCKHKSAASSITRKGRLEPSVALRAQVETIITVKRCCRQPSNKRANFSLQRKLRLPGKNDVSCKSKHANRIHDLP